MLRRQIWKRYGCNNYGVNPKSQPMSFWTEQDVLQYIVTNKLPIASVYGEIQKDKTGKLYCTGYSRTGCVFCGFGAHLEEPNKYQMLKKTHPKIHEYCMKPVSEGGLGFKEVLDYIHVKTE